MADLFQEVGVKLSVTGGEKVVSTLRSVGKETDRVANSSSNYSSQNTKAAKSTKNMSEANTFASRKINEVGMAVQQTGYQVGDFLVQIQSGTNAFVAFGQQATQLVGILPMFASRLNISVGTLIGLSSTLGFVIPLTTALAAAFIRSRDSARDTESAIDQLETAVSSYERAVKTLESSQSELNDEFGTFSEYALFAADRFKISAINEANEQIKSLANTLTDVSDLMGRQIPSSINRSIREFLDLNEGIRRNNELVAEFVNAQIRLDQAEGPRAQAEALKELSELFVSIVGTQDQMDDSQDQYYNSLIEAIELVAQLGASQEDINETIRERATIESTIANMQRELNESVQEILDFKEQELQNLRDQTELQEIANEFGEDSVEYANLKREQEEAAFLVYLEQNDILGKNAEEILRAWRALQDAKGAADSTAGAVSNITDRAREASQAAFGIFQNLRAAAMAMSATEAGIAAAERTAARGASEAEVRATQVAASEEARLSAIGVSGVELQAAVAQAFSNEMRRQQAQAAESAIYAGFDDSSGGSSPSGGGTPEWTSLFPELQAAYEEAEKLAKQYKDEVEILDSALENGLITQQQYNTYLAEAQEYYEQAGEAATEYEKILLMMAETTSDALGDAMMDIVTGTKSVADAFTDMTQIILKKAFELLVINPILNSIFGGVSGFNLLPSLIPGSTSANGNVFSAGNVQAFATGGVVGSPTYFPMANGQVGLMGEAGPEAIMPLKRGKGGRLGVEVNGEQGNVTINQTFAFSANGDDSVKKIIADEAPKIAALTQKQILDSRRRGGVVRDTFGR